MSFCLSIVPCKYCSPCLCVYLIALEGNFLKERERERETRPLSQQPKARFVVPRRQATAVLGSKGRGKLNEGKGESIISPSFHRHSTVAGNLRRYRDRPAPVCSGFGGKNTGRVVSALGSVPSIRGDLLQIFRPNIPISPVMRPRTT